MTASRLPAELGFTDRYRAGSELHLASGLLQHRDKELMDEHYNLACSLEVADLFGGWIDNIAGSGRGMGKGAPLSFPNFRFEPLT